MPYLSEAKESKHTDSSVTSLPSMSIPTSLNQSLDQEKHQFNSSAFNLNINLDLLGIGNSIRDAIVQSSNRSGFVKNSMETAFYSAGQRYNVMVFNFSLGYQNGLRGVKFYGSAHYH
ncbi:stress response protein YvgO, partial [Bacillus sp. GbtcB13]|uniref:stress response protein YvgO n=1 Tax=Bacillus sp. GbtcB13 TaxID=2824758 RepID=UPI0020C732CD